MLEVSLLLIWLLVFRRLITDPWSYATSEFVAVMFPLWRHYGRRLRSHQPLDDPYFYPDTLGIPFLCAWYPPHLLTAWLGTFLSFDSAFLLYATTIFLHYLLASWFIAQLFLPLGIIPALFAAVTFTYAQGFLKIAGYFTYTVTWLAFTLWMATTGNFWGTAIGVALTFAAGYTPIWLYTLPIIFAFMPVATLAGLFACGPQMISTAYHMRQSVRTRTTYADRTIGSVPPWHFITLFFPLRLNLNGVLYHELAYGLGRPAILLAIIGAITMPTGWIAIAIIAIYMMMGRYVGAPAILRCPSRWNYLLTIATVMIATPLLATLPFAWQAVLLALQVWDIAVNHPSYQTPYPLMERHSRPSDLFNSPLVSYLNTHLDGYRVSGLSYPLYTGHTYKWKTIGYTGGSMLKSVANLRGIGANGADANDWFATRPAGKQCDWYGIRYAYTPTKPSQFWRRTKFKHLWLNPYACKPPTWEEVNHSYS